MPKKYASLSWHDETVPISDKFDDSYYSLENGLLEANYVFWAEITFQNGWITVLK